MQLMPEGITENELYKTLRTPLTRVFDPKDRGDLPIGNGSYSNPVLIANLPVDPEMPGLRKIERDSLPVIDDSWFHQFQARMLVEFYKLQRMVGIGGNNEIEEEKLVQVDRGTFRTGLATDTSILTEGSIEAKLRKPCYQDCTM